jgi:hypothetical protein
MQNVDTMARKVCVRPKFFHPTSNYLCFLSEGRFICSVLIHVHRLVQFLNESYTVMLFHYDGNVDGWRGLEWSDKAIHVLAPNQTKW